MAWCKRFLFLIAAALLASVGRGDEVSPTPPHPGWTVLRTKPFLPPDFDQDVFDRLWINWPAKEQARAKAAPLPERRRLIADHYGLVTDPASTGDDFDLLGYVRTPRGWVMSCLVCHSGKVDGQVIAGLGNNRLALQTLTEDVRRTKLLSFKPLSHLDLAILKLPLNTTNGTSNSVIFGVVLGAKRLPDMSVDRSRPTPPLVHHDMDAPPWWHLRKKRRLYADGFSPKTHRAIMQFMLLPENDRETVLGWEEDFRQMLAWMETVEPPKYRGSINSPLAARGQAIFESQCADCHGTYGGDGSYPEKVIPLETVGTDPVRLQALSMEHRQWMKESWISHFGEDRVDLAPEGYVAPPLDGVWASAPYFHNGSVPTLQDVLAPSERPKVWRQTSEEFDRQRLGLTVERLSVMPVVKSDAERRWYFDTALPGKSRQGHDFGEALSDEERSAVLEYLKML